MGETLRLVLDVGQRRQTLCCVAAHRTKAGRMLHFSPRDADALTLPANLCVTRRGGGVWGGNVEQLAIDFGVVPLYVKWRLERVDGVAENTPPEPTMFELELGSADDGSDGDIGSALDATARCAEATRAEWLCGTFDMLPYDDARCAPPSAATAVPLMISARPVNSLVGPRGLPVARISWAAKPSARSPPAARAQRRRRAGTSPPIAIARAHSLSVARGERVADVQPVSAELTAAMYGKQADAPTRVFARDLCSLLDRRGSLRLEAANGAVLQCAVRATRGTRVGELFALELRSAAVTLADN